MCKYLYSNPTNSQWQVISSLYLYAQGELRLDDSRYIIIGTDSVLHSLHYLRITFGSLTADWARTIPLDGGTWKLYLSESILSEIGINIYSFITYEDPSYLYLLSFDARFGISYQLWHKSSISCSSVIGSINFNSYKSIYF